MQVLIKFVMYICVSLLFTGCILTHSGCIKSGHISAYECGRYADRYDSIEGHKLELEKLNKNIDVSKFGSKLTDNETSSFYSRFCKRYENKVLPIKEDIAADFKIDLGNYFDQKFCQVYNEKKELGLFEKITRTSRNYGYITWYITDGEKVYDYRNEPITYFKDGIKFGTANFVK